jgi:GNAT superfamily N-acetyltransferase
MTLETTLTLPALAGFTFRTFEGDGDYAHMARVSATQSEAEGHDFYPTPEWIKNMYESLDHFDVCRDVLMVEDAAKGDVVAYGRVGRAEQADGVRRYTTMVRSVPRSWGQGLGTSMTRWFEARAREMDAVLPRNERTVLETWAFDNQTNAVALLTREGFAPARYGYDMSRLLDDPTPIPNFRLPDGFEIRPATPEHYRAIWDADIEAFRDHNGFAEPGEARYQAWLNDPLFFQPDLWKVAWDIEKNEVAGMVQNFINQDENARLNRKRGYTEGISVRRLYRRRGLARALIVESLRMHKALGMTEAALSVDATNPTGALRVYEDCGFKANQTEVVYQKRLD